MNTRKRILSFAYAFKGIYHILKSQTNFQIQLFLAVIAVILGFVFHISLTEWCLLIFSMGIVLTSEGFNTSVEYLTDLVSPEADRKAGIIKDISAGAVLISSLASLVIGLLIFIPKIF